MAIRVTPSRARLTLAFAAVYLIWGSTYLAIRFALQTVPPFLVAGLQSLVGGLVLYAVARGRGDSPPNATHWRGAVFVGCLMLVGGVGGITWAEQHVSSGTAALLIATVPLWIHVLEWLQYGGSRPRGQTAVGLGVGLLGVALLIGPERFGAGRTDPLGAIVLTAAAILWAEGSLFSRRAPAPASPLLGTGMQMFAGGTLLLLLSGATGEIGLATFTHVSLRSALALAYLTLFGSIVAFTAYIWLLKAAPPSRVSTYAYVNPAVAFVLGWLAGDEILTVRTLLAAAMIVGAVVLIVAQRERPPLSTKQAAEGRVMGAPVMSNRLWVAKRMPLTQRSVELLRDELERAGIDDASALLCTHVEWKLTHLAELLSSVVELRVVGNTTTTCRPECVADLRRLKIDVFDSYGLSPAEHRKLLRRAVDRPFTFVFDDGAHAVPLLSEMSGARAATIAATEYTMSGIHRLRSSSSLTVPVYDLNSSFTKQYIGNCYGTGVSAVAAFLFVTNVSPSSLRVAVVGYGPVGQSVAQAFRGLGAVVTVCDVSGQRSAVARFEGFSVAEVREAAASCDVLITCTGRADALTGADFEVMNDGVILANVGHDDVEINMRELKRMAGGSHEIGEHITEYKMADGRRLCVLCRGALLNLSTGFGFPIEVIDYSFAAAVAVWAHALQLPGRLGLNPFPAEVDDRVMGWGAGRDQGRLVRPPAVRQPVEALA
jgi:adenosylhomocysteinase